MKLFKKLFAAALAACMALSLAACSDTTWVYDFGGEKIPSGVYIAYTMVAYQQVPQQEDYDSAITDVMKQTIEGKSAEEWIKAEAKESCARYVAIEQKFAELGMSLSEEDEAEIDSVLDSNWAAYGPIYEKNGVSEESYRKLMVSSKKESLLFTKYYDKDGIEEVGNEDLLAHFKENFASVNIFRMALYTNDDLTEDQQAENEKTVKLAEEYVNMLNSEGKTFGEVYDLYYHDVLGTAHDDENENDVIANDEDTRTWVKKNDDPNYSQKVIDTIFNEMKIDGDAKYIADEDKGYYYVVKRYDVAKDEKNFDEMRTTVLYDVKGDAFDELVKGWADGLAVTENGAAVGRYTPKNIDFTAPATV